MSEQQADYRALVAAAQAAAEANDAAEAERLLRAALEVHAREHDIPAADHAATLNNLGILCERRGDMESAERFFREACRFAAATLPAGDAAVTTSRENLRAFCVARGIAFDVPEVAADAAPVSADSSAGPDAEAPRSAPEAAVAGPSAAAATAPASHQVPPASTARPEAAPAPKETPPASRAARTSDTRAIETFDAPPRETRPTRPPVGTSRWPMIVAGVAVLAFAGWLFTGGDSPAEDPGAPTPASSEPAAPAVEPSRTADQAPPVAAETANTGAPAAPSSPAPAAVPSESTVSTDAAQAAAAAQAGASQTAAAPADEVVVSSAMLCRQLSTGAAWNCQPPAEPLEPGVLFFYTSVRSRSGARISHVWRHGDQVVRTVRLNVGANPETGYRTYSRFDVPAASRGDWVVEARGEDGGVLAEQRFTLP